jgi:hypothetical protein
MANETKATQSVKHVRVRTGGVHFGGARIISALSTDKTATAIASGGMIICESIAIHPAGVCFEPVDGGGKYIIPYANVEVITLE